MIITRTPFRISFFGGGTDYPEWYKKNGGSVISTTINKYSYINLRWLPQVFEYKHRIRYYQQEEVNSLDEIRHPTVRESAKLLNIKNGIEVVHNADLPARSGLGSSSSFTVGLLHALHTLKNNMPTKRELAMQAINVEQNLINEVVGSQDQVAAAFGGFNYIKFDDINGFNVEPIVINDKKINQLQKNLLLCFTGFSRTASEIAKEQINQIYDKKNELNTIKNITKEALEILLNNKYSINEFGKLLNDQWEIKKKLSNKITNRHINDIYNTAINNGALGGKLLGAGGGGFILFYAEQKNHNKIINGLKTKLFVPFRFDTGGSRVVYYARE